MSLSSVVYLINYVLVIFAVHSPLTGSTEWTDLVAPLMGEGGRTEADVIVDSANVCLSGLGAGLHSLLGLLGLVGAASLSAEQGAQGGPLAPTSASASAAALAAAVGGWTGECGFSLWHAFKDAFLGLIRRLVLGISCGAWYGRSGLMTQVLTRPPTSLLTSD